MAMLSLFHATHDFDACGVLRPVFDSGQLAAGPSVAALEAAVSALCQSRPVVSVSNMTHALGLAMTLAGVGQGDDVLTLSFNCMASNSAIAAVGARAVWVDMEPTFGRMDMEDLRRAITPQTKALVVYHLAGYPALMDDALAFCRAHGLALIEDANNAWLAADAHVRTELPADVLYFSVFSLYANRQVNGVEGALLVCPTQDLAARAKRLCRYGIDGTRFRLAGGEINPHCDITEVGMNASLNAVNAGLALRHLASVSARVAQSRFNAQRLALMCASNAALKPVQWASDGLPAFWVFLLLSPHRDALAAYLLDKGVQASRLHFPNHHYAVFGALTRALPGTAVLQEQLLAVPCGAWLSAAEVSFIGECLQNFSVN